VLIAYGFFHRDDRPLFLDWIALSAAGLIGEETCIGFYRFYSYASGWHLTLGFVPIFIALIWPPVILSARSVARALLSEKSESALRLAVVTGLLVVFDAALIEPIAVRAGLWSWSLPGIFGVPVIGILGWGVFAAAATLWLETARGAPRWLVIVFAPIVTHLLLIASWWSAVRWCLRNPISNSLATVVVATASLCFLSCVIATRASLASRELVPRFLATLLFAGLLVAHGDASLAIYAACFVPPHVALCVPKKSQAAEIALK
jgi:uncharacterized membrane protein